MQYKVAILGVFVALSPNGLLQVLLMMLALVGVLENINHSMSLCVFVLLFKRSGISFKCTTLNMSQESFTAAV